MDLILLLLILISFIVTPATSQVCDLITAQPSYAITAPTAVPTFTVSSPTVYIGNPLGGSNVTVRGATLVTSSASNPDWTVGTAAPNANTYGWEDVTVDLVARSSGANVPSFTEINGWGLYAYNFPQPGTQLYLYWNMHVPHRYAPGTGWYIHTHFITSTTPTAGQTVIFTYSTTYADRDTGVFAAPISSTATYTFPPASAQFGHFVAETANPIVTAAPSTTSVTVDGILTGSVTRTAGTYGGAVWVIFVDAHIQTSKFNTKNRAAPFYT